MEAGADALATTETVQPALFALEYSLARPGLVVGHRSRRTRSYSIGEFVCAALAGVMSMEDAIGLVALRGRLMNAQPPGSMLSVRPPVADVARWYLEAAGARRGERPRPVRRRRPDTAIEALEARLAAEGVAARRLVTSHAFHSAMMDPVVAPMRARLATIARAHRASRSCPRSPATG